MVARRKGPEVREERRAGGSGFLLSCADGVRPGEKVDGRVKAMSRGAGGYRDETTDRGQRRVKETADMVLGDQKSGEQDGLPPEVSRHSRRRRTLRPTKTLEESAKPRRQEVLKGTLLAQPLYLPPTGTLPSPQGIQAHTPAPKLLTQLLLPLQQGSATLVGSGQARWPEGGGGSCASRGREDLGAALRVLHTKASQSQRRHLEHNIVMKTCEKLTFSQTAGVSEATGLAGSRHSARGRGSWGRSRGRLSTTLCQRQQRDKHTETSFTPHGSKAAPSSDCGRACTCVT